MSLRYAEQFYPDAYTWIKYSEVPDAFSRSWKTRVAVCFFILVTTRYLRTNFSGTYTQLESTPASTKRDPETLTCNGPRIHKHHVIHSNESSAYKNIYISDRQRAIDSKYLQRRSIRRYTFAISAEKRENILPLMPDFRVGGHICGTSAKIIQWGCREGICIYHAKNRGNKVIIPLAIYIIKDTSTI